MVLLEWIKQLLNAYKDGTLRFDLKRREEEKGVMAMEGTATLAGVEEMPKRLTLMVTAIRTGDRDVQWKWDIPVQNRP